MTIIKLEIPERPADIGEFAVGRILPYHEKRMVGPFIFIDHMGPVTMGPERNMDVGPHPHIGLATLTYLLEGSIMHRDSLGTEIEIKPGEVNWMTAGKGVTHSERTPEYLRGSEKSVHGLQIWIALPKDLEEIDPDFYHAGIDELPVWEDSGVKFTLIAGEAYGKSSLVPVYSNLFFLRAQSEKGAPLDLTGKIKGEVAVYVMEGGIAIEGRSFGKSKTVVLDEDAQIKFELNPGSDVFIFGGLPFPEERKIYWNFVASDIKLLEKAAEMWKNREFPPIPGDDGYIPLPEPGFRIKK